MVKKMYDACMDQNVDVDTLQPEICGTDAEYKAESEKVAATMATNNPHATD